MAAELNICVSFTSLRGKFCGSQEHSARCKASGVAGSMTWKLTGGADNTRVQLSYSVGGFIDGGFEKIAPAVESVLREQLDRLKQFAETGKPTTTAINRGFRGRFLPRLAYAVRDILP